MSVGRVSVVLMVIVVFAVGFCVVGCLTVKAPEEIKVGVGGGREPIDTSRVPPTASHEEARQRLAEAYERIRHLEGKVRGLEQDKRELKADREEVERKYEKEKKRHGD